MVFLPSRRKLISGLAALIAAPSIVRAQSLMQIRGLVLLNSMAHPENYDFEFDTNLLLLKDYERYSKWWKPAV